MRWIASIAASICSSVIALTPPLWVTSSSRGTSRTNSFEKHCRLLLHHLVDRGSTATLKGEVHLADRVGVEGVTRAVDVAGSVSLRAPSHNSQSSRHPSSIRPATCVTTGWDRAYYDQTAQEETMMAFTAMLSELYDAFRRKVGADEPPAKAAAEAVVIEDARFRSIDGKFDALSHTMDQRFDTLSQRFDVLSQSFDGLSRLMDQRFGAFGHTMDQRLDALSQRFDVLNQPFDGLSRAMDKRFDALNHAMDQRSDVLSGAMDQRFGAFGQAMGQRLDTLSRMIDERFATVDQRFAAMDQHLAARDAQLVRLETKTATVDDQLARLETKTATEFRRLRWGLDIVIALLFGLVTKVILDWAMP
jgi:hypothetical protein